jgi:hypothetical protein
LDLTKIKHQKLKNEKKTDKIPNPKYELDQIKRLVLYILGKSHTAIYPSQIENEIKKGKYIGRPNYVYEVVKDLAPDTDVFPHTLLFKYNDLIDKDKPGELKVYNDEAKEKLEKKICSKIFDSFYIYLGWKDKSNLLCNFFSEENEGLYEIIIKEKNSKDEIEAKSIKIYFGLIIHLKKLLQNCFIRKKYLAKLGE